MTTSSEPFSRQAKSISSPNHWRLIWAIARKDLVEIVTNTQFIVIALLPVVVFLLYRLMMMGIDNSSILDIAVYDLGASQLVNVMQENPALELHLVTSEAALQEQINEGPMSGLLIPANFDADVAAGLHPELNIWLNPERGMSSETIQWQRLVEAEIMQMGQQSLPAQIEWIELESEAFSSDTALNSFLLIVTLTMIFFLTGTNLVAMLITEEKEKQMGNVLINSPANPYHVVLGKALAGSVSIAAVLALVVLLNGGLTGNWPLALLYLAIALPISLSISTLTGSLAQSSKQCNSWLGLAMIIFLAPAWFSTMIELPEPFGTIFSVMPTHFLVAGLDDALNNSGVSATNSLNLTAWLVFMLVLVGTTFWRLRQNPKSVVASR
ncbi:MAG: ABC transporter permease [Ardenticatenaceae bacterium]|nr:ABC transporter permease [Ardenticatenaceae bacterium]